MNCIQDDTANIGANLTEDELSVVYDDKGIDKLMLKVAKKREDTAQNELFEKVEKTYEDMKAMKEEIKEELAQLRKLLQPAKK